MAATGQALIDKTAIDSYTGSQAQIAYGVRANTAKNAADSAQVLAL